VVANLVAGSGADQGSRLAGYAVRYVLAQKGSPRSFSRVLDSTPGLSRVSQTDGSELWRVDAPVSRITITSKGAQPVSVASGRVEAHTTVPAGPSGRVLRLADSAAPGWHASLDGTALTATTVDGWAQGFELPASGGHLDVTYQEPVTHVGWLGAQAFLLLVVVVLALPGRRRDIDDDLPEAEGQAAVPAQASGEGRRARRLQAAAEAEAAAQQAARAPEAAEPQAEPPAGPPADAPEQPSEDDAGYAAPTAYGTAGAEYDPYAVPAGTDYTYQEGYVDPAYAQAGDSYAQAGDAAPAWEGQQGYPGQDGYGADPTAYGDGYGYVPQQPGYDPYDPQGAQGGAPGYAERNGYPDQNGYAEQDGYADRNGYGEQDGYGDQNAYGDQNGYADGQGYAAQADPAGYYTDGDQHRDGSDHR
jgi:hypothetical protein